MKNSCRNKYVAIVVFVVILIGIGGLGYIVLENKSGLETDLSLLTEIIFEKDSLNLDTVKYGTKKKIVYNFKNIGMAPFIIHHVHTSCGCTHVSWEKAPIAPGNKGKIEIVFEPNSLGVFEKTIHVRGNIEKNGKNLKLFGVVKE